MDPKPLSTPDVTWIQGLVGLLTGVIVAAIACINSFGWANITVDQSAKLLGLWAAVGAALVFADAHIRNGRARAFNVPPKGVVAEEHTPLPLKTPVKRTRKT